MVSAILSLKNTGTLTESSGICMRIDGDDFDQLEILVPDWLLLLTDSSAEIGYSAFKMAVVKLQ